MRLIADDLTCQRGGRLVFSGLTCSVASGEMLELRGANGAGKTSLLRMIAGLLEPAGGRLALEGGEADLALSQQCHLIAHQDALKPALSVAENLRFWSGFFGGGGDVGEALKLFRLDGLASLPAAFLSAGQRRRLALSRLAVRHRPVWLLDEPTVGLDAASCAVLRTVMQAHLDSGGMIVATTHADLGMKATRVIEIGATAAAAA